MKLTIRPKLSYTYIPDVEQADLPDFDSVDAIEDQRHYLPVNSTLTGKLKREKFTGLPYFDLARHST